jgi:hypothetical protein
VCSTRRVTANVAKQLLQGDHSAFPCAKLMSRAIMHSVAGHHLGSGVVVSLRCWALLLQHFSSLLCPPLMPRSCPDTLAALRQVHLLKCGGAAPGVRDGRGVALLLLLPAVQCRGWFVAAAACPVSSVQVAGSIMLTRSSRRVASSATLELQVSRFLCRSVLAQQHLFLGVGGVFSSCAALVHCC